MEIVSVTSHWDSLLNPQLLERLDDTDFLTRCRAQTVSRKDLETFLQQHYFYSRNFTRFLGALISNLTHEGDREELAENLFEEMGLGDLGSIPHSRIYRRMIDRMGVDVSGAIAPGTERFVRTMLEFCRDPDPMVGMGALCLGAEAIVPHFYSQVVRGLLGVGERIEDLEFFTIHIEGDDDHALTMKRIIEREVARDPRNRLTLLRSAEEIISARVEFLESVMAPAALKKESPYVALHV